MWILRYLVGPPEKEERVLFTVDVTNKKLYINEAVVYDMEGKMIDRMKDSSPDPISVVPDTYGETVYNIARAWVRRIDT